MGAHRKKGTGGKTRVRWCQGIAAQQRHHASSGTDENAQAITPAIEDYVKVLALAQQGQQHISTNLVAVQIGVRAASVTKVFQRLQRLGLIIYAPYHGVSLTEEGQHLAHALLRRNRLIAQFLADVLGCTPDEVQADADILEHVISDALEQRIATYLGQRDAGNAAPGKVG